MLKTFRIESLASTFFVDLPINAELKDPVLITGALDFKDDYPDPFFVPNCKTFLVEPASDFENSD